MTVTQERAPHTEAAQPQGSRNSNRGLIAVIAVLALIVVGLGAWAIYDQTTGSDADSSALALDPEIEELVSDYFAAKNAYDPVAFGELTTDSYTEYVATFPSGGAASETTKAEILDHLEFTWPRAQMEIERLGEPFMMGYPDNGMWHVAQAWQLSFVDPDGDAGADEGTGILTIVDDNGTLKVARSIGVRHSA